MINKIIKFGNKRYKKETVLSLIAMVLIVSGCSVQTQPIDFEANSVVSYQRIDTIIKDEEPITGPISLYEAMARALKYNLDEKIELLDEEFRRKQTAVTQLGMIPSITASFGVDSRNNESGSSSRSILSGQESLEPSSSSEKTVYSGDLIASWDILDFGLSYVHSKQNSDERLIAAERRRKVINRILEDVRTAYWRAVSADRTHKKLVKLEALTQKALLQAETLEKRRLAPPLKVLNYQRDLLQIQSTVQRMQRELLLAKKQLAALMNLKPNSYFKLVLPDRTDVVPELPGSAQQMVMIALQFRSELRESAYRERINVDALQEQFISSLPGFRTVLGINYNSNEFLYNEDWINISSRISWDLTNLFRYPLQRKALKAEAKVIQARADALTMAIMTQVHVARARFIRFSQELNTIRMYNDVQGRILTLTQNGFKAKAISQRDLVKEEMNSILSEVRYDTAYADLQNAYANLYASMGVDNFDFNISPEAPIAEIAEKLRNHWEEQAVALPAVPEIPK